MLSFFCALNLPRSFWAFLLYLRASAEIREQIRMDVARYRAVKDSLSWWRLHCYLYRNLQGRNIFYYRVKRHRVLCVLSKWCLPEMKNIEIISGRIGGGLKIQHRSGCVISLTSAGKNLNVGQGVTIGVGRTDEQGRNTPILGDDVDICTNAVVLGPVTLGNHVTVGAGAVVTHDVPDYAVVAGVPARIIKFNEK